MDPLDVLALRRVIEGRCFVAGKKAHQLRVIGVDAHADHSTYLLIAICPSRATFRLNVSKDHLADPTAVWEEVLNLAGRTLISAISEGGKEH